MAAHAREIAADGAQAARPKAHGGGRRCACGGVAGPTGECAACRARRLAGLSVQRAPLPGAPAAARPASWLVEDGETDVVPGQMAKSLWLAELKAAICARADEELKPTGRSSEGCPVLAFYIGYFTGRPAAEIVTAVHRYAPETAAAMSARDAIPPIVERVGAAVAVWAATGQITGIPEGGFRLGVEDGTDAGAVQRKGRGGGGAGRGGAAQPRALLGRLGAGRPLDGGVRSRMEPVFGRDLSAVRLHDGSAAASLSAGLDARAFTVGNHIALGAGEYQPGTVEGDALLAHELAHVVQQTGASASAAPLRDGSPAYEAFERDADVAAAGAVASLWGGLRAGAGPRLRSGLAVQRCRRTVKRCPAGMSWQVVGDPAGMGPTCICVWQCRPGTGGRYARSAGGGGGPRMYCTPPCPSPPVVEEIPTDHVIKAEGTRQDPSETKAGLGAHLTPLGGTAMCGCLPLDVEGDPTGEEQELAPLKPTGFDVTDVAGAGRGRVRGTTQRRAPTTQQPPPVKKAVEPPPPKAPDTPPPVKPPAVTQPDTPPPPAKTGNPQVNFANKYKVDQSPSSMEGLAELYRRSSSGTRTNRLRPGKYLPGHTVAAAGELRTIVDLASRPEVVKIELIPSSSKGRSPDLVIDVRQADGTIVRERVEITAATGGGRGYQDVGGGARQTGVAEAVAAVRRKAASTSSRPSQLDAPLPGVPVGGTLSVQLPRSTSAQGPVDVALAMTILAPELAGAPHVKAVEFHVPGPKGRKPLRYTRNPDGTYTLQPAAP